MVQSSTLSADEVKLGAVWAAQTSAGLRLCVSEIAHWVGSQRRGDRRRVVSRHVLTCDLVPVFSAPTAAECEAYAEEEWL